LSHFAAGVFTEERMMQTSTQHFGQLPDEALVPAAVAADVLGISRATVWRLSKTGALSPRKIGVRNTRFLVGQIRSLAGNAEEGIKNEKPGRQDEFEIDLADLEESIRTFIPKPRNRKGIAK
jgi:predicted DNA-binding transcriptional regulator AlpA